MTSTSAEIQDTADETNSVLLSEVRVTEAVNQGVVINAAYTIADDATTVPLYKVGLPVDVLLTTTQKASGSIPAATSTRRFRGVVTHVSFSRGRRVSDMIKMTKKKDMGKKKDKSTSAGSADVQQVTLTIESKIRLLSRFKMYRTYTDTRPAQLMADMIGPTLGLSGLGFLDQSRFEGTDASVDTRANYLIQAGDDCWTFLQYYLAEHGLRMVVYPGAVGTEIIHLEDELSTGETRTFSLSSKASSKKPAQLLSGITLGQLNLKEVEQFLQEGASGRTVFYNYFLGTVHRYTEQPETPVPSTSITSPIKIDLESLQQNGDKQFTNRVLAVEGFSTDEATRRSKYLYESQTVNRWKLSFITRTPTLAAGMNISVDTVLDGQTLLIEQVEHVLADGGYTSELSTRDGTKPWRAPPQILPSSINAYTFIGTIYGGSDKNVGDRVPLDEYGRAPVVLMWDHNPAAFTELAAGATLPVQRGIIYLRYVQKMSGKGTGIKYDPQHGEEVLVRSIQGRPDAAVIVGAMFNKKNQIADTLLNSDGGIAYNIQGSASDVAFSGILFQQTLSEDDRDDLKQTAIDTEDESEAGSLADDGSYIFKTSIFLPESLQRALADEQPTGSTATTETETPATVNTPLPTWLDDTTVGFEYRDADGNIIFGGDFRAEIPTSTTTTEVERETIGTSPSETTPTATTPTATTPTATTPTAPTPTAPTPTATTPTATTPTAPTPTASTPTAPTPTAPTPGPASGVDAGGTSLV